MGSNANLLIIKKVYLGGVKLDFQFTQLIKGLCCVLIALAHYPHQSTDGIGWKLYDLFIIQGAHASVAMFFFLSGFGLMESETKKHLNIWQFIIRRLLKIYKAVLIINILHYGSILCFGYFQTGIWDSIDWKLLLSIAKLDFHFWFIEILFSCYFVFAICTQIKQQKIRTVTLTFGQLAVLFFWLIKGDAIHHVMSIPFFLVGLYVSLHKDKVALLMKNIWLWIILAITIFAVCYRACILYDTMPIPIVANILIVLGLLWLTSCYEIKLGYKSFLGYISFPIYLVHWKVILFSSSFGHIIPLWLYMILTIYFAWLLQKTIEISFTQKKL